MNYRRKPGPCCLNTAIVPNCGDILKATFGRSFNLADRNESADYLAAGGTQKCSDLVADAVRVAAELIMDQT